MVVFRGTAIVEISTWIEDCSIRGVGDKFTGRVTLANPGKICCEELELVQLT
jgi:hypothetical protein